MMMSRNHFSASFCVVKVIAVLLLLTSDKKCGRSGIMLQRIVEEIVTVIRITTAVMIHNDTFSAFIKNITLINNPKIFY